MTKKLLVVESPAKARALQKYLGKDFNVLASYGHVRDLLPKTGAVVPEDSFRMHYVLLEKNKKHVEAICEAAKKARSIYLATDPDREGEAIAWHLAEILHERGIEKPLYRVVYQEVTPKAVADAIANPRELSMPLIQAQQTRRALDYLVGFHLSPLLWRKIRPSLSAGRVQSPALRLIAEREEEIEHFVPQEYWSIHLAGKKEVKTIRARLGRYQGKAVEQFSFPDEASAKEAALNLQGKFKQEIPVFAIARKKKNRQPQPPFITATLQQEAAKKLGLTSDRTMRLAQELFEGIEIGGETVGLITYMRTDSTHLAHEAIEDIRQLVQKKFGKDYLPASPRQFKSKSKTAQEAHEAIRPTDAFKTPESIKAFLGRDHFRLYELIWKRTLASQMKAAVFDTVAIDLGDKTDLFRASGQTLLFPGFLALYDDRDDQDEENTLPEVQEGEIIAVDTITFEQHFTAPPPHYTEASLIKTLEEYGIGRPSTYASIIGTLIKRNYVVRDKKKLVPTEVGRIVAKFLCEHFDAYVDYDFTARMEDNLDEIASAKIEGLPVLENFWQPFAQRIGEKSQLSRKEVLTEEIGEACPECGKPLLKRFGKHGSFIACSGYPECAYTRPIDEDETKDYGPCPKCGHPLVVRQSRYGKFIGCSNYPACRHIEPFEKPQHTGIACPVCQKGELVARKSRYGKVFYGCSNYPECNFALWHPPVASPCPKCNFPVRMQKTTKRRGAELVCPVKSCSHSESITIEEEAKAASS
jgi:DNA topoisomerase-1